MRTYYLEVIKEGLSICLDSDINFYHHYKIGDVIKMNYKSNEAYLHFNNLSVKYDGFTIDWSKVNQKRLSVVSCINIKYITDITKQIERVEKLNRILSDESDT